jgi:hypothetical protein
MATGTSTDPGRPAPSAVREALEPKALLAAASDEAGLDDYGDLGFVEPLEHWVDALADSGQLSAVGVQVIRANTIRLLVNRLRLEADVRRHPEILDEDVSDPIVIIGLPRTGTTKLQRLLARHPAVQGLPTWKLLNPAPFPNAVPGQRDPRIAAAEEAAAMSAAMFPDFQAGHPSQPEEVDEELFMLEMTFEAMTYWRADLPEFEAWWRIRPRSTPYVYLRRLLQYLQWQDGGKRGRSFVLKSPLHLGFVDMLCEHFPNATLVHCHRDPRESVPSNARLHELTWLMGTDRVDRHRVGDVVVEFWSRALADNLAQRERYGDRILDVGYQAIVRDALGVARQTLHRHGMELTEADAEAMLAWERANPQHRFGRHEYSQQAYGLTDARIEQAFGPYLERFFPAEGAW